MLLAVMASIQIYLGDMIMTIYNARERNCPIPCPPMPPVPPMPPFPPAPVPVPYPVIGPMGPQGPIGPQGPAGVTEYASFYATAPADNPTAILPSGAVAFPNTAANSANITRLTNSTFNIAQPGTYLVSFRVNSNEAGQLQLALNGVAQPNTTFGQASANSDISGTTIINTTTPNTTLSVINPATATTNITVTPNAGGTQGSTSDLTILKLA